MNYRIAVSDDINYIYNAQIITYNDAKYHESIDKILDIITIGTSFIIEYNKEIIGYCLIHYLNNINNPPKCKEYDTVITDNLYIHDFVIIPKYQKTGISYKFAEFILNYYKNKVLNITLISLPNAIQFWKNNKFIELQKISDEILYTYDPSSIYMVYQES